jgi:hypothetical protein
MGEHYWLWKKTQHGAKNPPLKLNRKGRKDREGDEAELFA